MPTAAKPSTISQALVKAQAELPRLQREKVNPHFGHKYVSLEAILTEVVPILNKHGLSISQWPTFVNTGNGDGVMPALRTRLTHDSGEWLEDTMLLLASKSDPQGQGSAITYARRYAAMAALGLVADEDDDGQAATAHQPEARASVKSAPDKPITDAQRKVIFGKARGYDIDKEWIPRILRYATKGKISTADEVQTNGQLDFVLQQLEAFSLDMETSMAAIELWEQQQMPELPADPPSTADFDPDDDDDLPFE